MEQVFNILYFGDDPELSKQIQELLNKTFIKKLRPQFANSCYQPRVIIEAIQGQSIHIVYIDFTSIQDVSLCLEEIRWLKINPSYKSILFVGILKEIEKDENLDTALVLNYITSGISYIYCKGNEFELCFSDTIYIALGLKIPGADYTRAQNIGKAYPIGISTSISEISDSYFVVETDIEAQDHLSFKLPFLDELETSKFEIIEHKQGARYYPFTETYNLKFPLAGPWDELNGETLQPEQINNWLEVNAPDGRQIKSNILILSGLNELVSKVFRINLDGNIWMTLHSSINTNDLFQLIVHQSIEMVFWNISQEDKHLSVDSLYEIIAMVKNLKEVTPFFVIGNCKSASEALRKLFDYNQIISFDAPINGDLIDSLIPAFQNKVERRESPPSLVLSPLDPRRSFSIRLEVTLTSMSESDITFITEAKLPMYSVFLIQLPVTCFVTLVPPKHDLKSVQDKKHYQGLIHGLSEESSTLLRKFINQIIYKPIEAFTAEQVKSLLNHDLQKSPDKPVDNRHAAPPSPPPQESDHGIKQNLYIRPDLKGKSKL